jgi:hypothetical protein
MGTPRAIKGEPFDQTPSSRSKHTMPVTQYGFRFHYVLKAIKRNQCIERLIWYWRRRSCSLTEIFSDPLWDLGLLDMSPGAINRLCVDVNADHAIRRFCSGDKKTRASHRRLLNPARLCLLQIDCQKRTSSWTGNRYARCHRRNSRRYVPPEGALTAG